MKTLILTTLSLALMTSSAFATACQSRVNDVPDIVVPGKTGTKVVGSSTGKDGWDGTGGQCLKPGSGVIWVGPRDEGGWCLTPASLVGTVAGPIMAPFKDPDTIIITPDDPEYRIGVQVPATRYTPTFWLGTNWKDGSCPSH